MSFNFAPRGWAQCNGQLLPINQNQGLFSLLGNTYGGDGRTTFALPNLQGRIPLHKGTGFVLGQTGGETTHVLTSNEIPPHTHQAVASSSTTGVVDTPAGNLLTTTAPNFLYGPAANLESMKSATITNAGGSQAHENRQPFLVVNFCIALQGVFPSPT